MDYEVIIGLEVHVELSTKSKIFCGCTTEFGGEPNTHCCPVCTGMPGTLPVLNKKAVEYTVKTGLALNCAIALYSKMDRKNYYYPDLPKAYQISQYDLPLCSNGYLELIVNNKSKRIRINRIHLEEDAGKLIHHRSGSGTLVDYNRSGVPLIEVVTEPDIRSPEEAILFLEALKSILQYIEVSDCKMQEGSFRCDINLSVRPLGQEEYGVRTEIKNINSFSAAYSAMKYENRRQIQMLKSGNKIIQETRRWDDVLEKSISMRSKEEASDYRYFPEPDLVPIILDDGWIMSVKNQLPELPLVKKKRFMSEYQLSEQESDVLTSSKHLAELFENCVRVYNNPKIICNWFLGDLLRLVKERSLSLDSINLDPKQFEKMLKLVDDGVISGSMAKTVFEIMLDTQKDPEEIVEQHGLKQISDEDELLQIIQQVIKQNPKSISDYKKGKKKAAGFLVGQTMQATKGKANPHTVNKILMECLKNLDK